uniref:Uncharacterized protein n=1 Tax=Astyanax mexicanus TaxID=7994 RepID=A0A3B1JC32_ASTMX
RKLFQVTFPHEDTEEIPRIELVRDVMHKIVEKSTDSPEEYEQVLHAKSTAYSTKEYKEVLEYFREHSLDWHNPKQNTFNLKNVLNHLFITFQAFLTVPSHNNQCFDFLFFLFHSIKSSIDKVSAGLTDQ